MPVWTDTAAPRAPKPPHCGSSRPCPSGSMANHMRAELVNQALTMAIGQRQPAAGVIMHTDRGSQYGADSYRHLLTQYGLQPSMSRKGTVGIMPWQRVSFTPSRPNSSIWRPGTRMNRPRQRCLSISKCSVTASAVIRRMAISPRWPMSRL